MTELEMLQNELDTAKLENELINRKLEMQRLEIEAKNKAAKLSSARKNSLTDQGQSAMEMMMARKKFLNYKQAAEYYSIGMTKMQALAKEARAVYKIDKRALVNTEIMDKYFETFRVF